MCPAKVGLRGQLGALEVQTRGVRFKLGTGFSEAQRRQPPPVGSKVSYRYRDLTDAGVPRLPASCGWRTSFERNRSKPAQHLQPAGQGGRECSFGGSGCAWRAPG